MSTPCNNLTLVPIKVSQLSRYRNIDITDYFLTIESGSKLISRKSTFADLVNAFKTVTGSYSGSFSGSFKGSMTGSLSGSFYGSVRSKNTSASGSLSGSFYGSIKSKNTSASGSFSGSFYGSIKSKNISSSGSLSGSFYGSVRSKNLIASGSLSGSFYGSVRSKNLIASGSLSGSFYGSVRSKNLIASGSLSGSFYGDVKSKNVVVTGSFRGINNITNFVGSLNKSNTKKVSYNGTSSYSVYSLSSSFALTSSFLKLTGGSGGGSPIAFAHASWDAGYADGTLYNCSLNVSGDLVEVIFTTAAPTANYTVIAYTSDQGNDTPYKYSNIYAQLGTVRIHEKTAAKVSIVAYVSRYESHDDNSDHINIAGDSATYNNVVIFA